MDEEMMDEWVFRDGSGALRELGPRLGVSKVRSPQLDTSVVSATIDFHTM